MKCPYCNEEMENGNIMGGPADHLYWLPVDAKLINPIVWTKNAMELKGGILLSKEFSYRKNTTHICRKCNKGVLEF